MFRYLLLVGFIFGFCNPALAIAPGNSCTTTGQTATGSSATAGIMNLMYCNGSTWVLVGPRIGDSVTTCNSGAAGTLRYNSGALSVCDGSAWRGLAQSGTATTPGVPGEGGTGYFVMSSASHDGNFSGLSGLNTFCRNDLSTNSWLGKPGTLDTSKVFAFAASGNVTQEPTQNSTYYFAVSGSTTVGGAYFQTNASQQGPGDNASWSASNRFGANYTYWTGRSYCQTSTLWGKCGGEGGSCASWTSNSASSYPFVGSAGATDGSRFLAGQDQCSNSNRVICFVNP